MFLTKLKVVSAVVLTMLVGTGLAGWSYRAAAQSDPSPQPANARDPAPRQERPVPRADRPAADELDALRLEIEALRKDFKAMRERVKVLEAQVGGQKRADLRLKESNYILRGASDLPSTGNLDRGWVGQAKIPEVTGQWYAPIDLANHPAQSSPAADRASDYLAEAEAAIKRLRQNPHDSQAAELLERATQRLKARAKGEKPRPAGNNPASP